VALLFIIFEVELAFFFPPAVVFGKLNQLRGPNFGPIVEFSSTDSSARITPAAKDKFAELTIPAASIEQAENQRDDKHTFHDDLNSLSLMALLDIAVFFVVLLVGFAFLWKQGDLNWVRAVARPGNQANIKLAATPLPGDMP
jgi:NADH-quinone oxidoreductase subunit A